MNHSFIIISKYYLALSFVSFIIITYDIIFKRKQAMGIMNLVWPITALWGGVFALIVYFWCGRAKEDKKLNAIISGSTNAKIELPHIAKDDHMDMANMSMMPNDEVAKDIKHRAKLAQNPKPEIIAQKHIHHANHDVDEKVNISAESEILKSDHMDMANMKPMEHNHSQMMNMDMTMDMGEKNLLRGAMLSTLHCGAGCTLADIIGEFSTISSQVSITFQWGLDYILALIFGLAFQYMAIKQMSNMPFCKAIKKAIKADFFSLTSWQIGMYFTMGFAMFYLFKDYHFSKTSTEFWFLMQIAMCVGFLFSYPVNIILIKAKIKNSM